MTSLIESSLQYAARGARMAGGRAEANQRKMF